MQLAKENFREEICRKFRGVKLTFAAAVVLIGESCEHAW